MKKKYSRCSRCRWCNNNQGINCEETRGPSNTEILFMGEAFGADEAEAGEPFVGPAGKVFDKLLALSDPPFLRAEVGITNSMRCYLKSNPTPTKREMDACLIYTYKDIQRIKPKLVVAMGASALYQTTGLEGIGKYRGKVLWSDKINCKVYATYHPAACMYDESRKPKMEKDFANIRMAMESEPFEPKHYDYISIDTVEEFNNIYESLLNTEIGFDLETTGLDSMKDDIVLLQLGTRDKIYVIGGAILNNIKSELNTIFNTSEVIGQDFTFDVKFLHAKLGIFPKKWKYDTCLGEYVVSGIKDNDLTFLTEIYVPESLGYDDGVIRAGGAHKLKDGLQLRQYAADDVGVLRPIRKAQYKKMSEQGSLWLYENATLPCNKVLTRMSIKGVKYNIDKINEIDSLYKKRADRALFKAMSIDGIEACQKKFRKIFNPRSSQMLKWLLIDYYELPVLKTSAKTQGPSIGKDEMKVYAEKYNNDYCKIMEHYRSLQNIRSNFLYGVLDKMDGNNRLHTDYSLHATTSGRPNSTNPNLLNIPEDVYPCIEAEDGYVLLYSDLSQVEVRMSAVHYMDDALISICNTEGSDFHSLVASRIFNISYGEFYNRYTNGDKVIDRMRRIAKTTVFGVLYQMGAEELAHRIGVSLLEAEKFIYEYFEGFPQLRDNIEKTKRFVIENGYLENYFKFRRRWKYHSEDDRNTLREAVNFPIQSLAWNLMELILIEVDKFLEDKRSELIMQTYDSLVVETYKPELDVVSSKINDIMSTIHLPFERLNKVKLLNDMKVGKNLEEMEKLL
uniref:DNA-directed DNA polymerase n=1 Tax=viral metagenome TaxID=1070528 RepID=A0A6H1ZA79_9ZZZZ